MGTPKWVGTSGALIEQPLSPTTELAERWTRTRTFKGPYTLCLSSSLARGVVGTGADAGWVVTRSVVSKDRGDVGTLVITYEAAGTGSGAQLPPITFSFNPEKLQRPLKYHPRYASLSEKMLDAVDKALESDSLSGNQYYNYFSGTPLAVELYNKRKRGQESYIIYGLKYEWKQATWAMPALTLGGFLDTPTGPGSGGLPAGSWLRLADECVWSGYYFETAYTWIGSPSGDWDPDLY